MPKRIREGFPRQRLVVVPASVLRRCEVLPIVRELHVTDIGCYPSAPKHYVRREHGAQQAILIGCLGGKGTLQIGAEQLPISRGVVFVVPPRVPHAYQADQDDPWSLFWVCYRGKQTLATLACLGVCEAAPLVHVPDVRRLKSAFEGVYACLSYHYSDAGLLAMSAELMRLLSEVKLHRGRPLDQSERRLTEERVLQTIEFMESHLHLPLRLKELAAQTDRSVSHYSQMFREITGQAPMTYFAQLKTRKACELLDETSLTVREIATRLGYNDPLYFSRHFKSVQGSSPTVYRAAVKG